MCKILTWMPTRKINHKDNALTLHNLKIVPREAEASASLKIVHPEEMLNWN